jgi:hypothetical protein
MSKSVPIPTMPRIREPAERWISAREEPAAPKPTKRFTVDIDEALHLRMKLDCTTRGENMTDVVRKLIEERWPEGEK